MLPGVSRITCMIYIMFPGLDLYYADPAQPLTTAGKELDDLDELLLSTAPSRTALAFLFCDTLLCISCGILFFGSSFERLKIGLR